MIGTTVSRPGDPLGEFGSAQREQAQEDAKFVQRFLNSLEAGDTVAKSDLDRFQRIVQHHGMSPVINRLQSLWREVQELRPYRTKWDTVMDLLGAIGRKVGP